eukprot:870540_1
MSDFHRHQRAHLDARKYQTRGTRAFGRLMGSVSPSTQNPKVGEGTDKENRTVSAGSSAKRTTQDTVRAQRSRKRTKSAHAPARPVGSKTRVTDLRRKELVNSAKIQNVKRRKVGDAQVKPEKRTHSVSRAQHSRKRARNDTSKRAKSKRARTRTRTNSARVCSKSVRARSRSVGSKRRAAELRRKAVADSDRVVKRPRVDDVEVKQIRSDASGSKVSQSSKAQIALSNSQAEPPVKGTVKTGDSTERKSSTPAGITDSTSFLESDSDPNEKSDFLNVKSIEKFDPESSDMSLCMENKSSKLEMLEESGDCDKKESDSVILGKLSDVKSCFLDKMLSNSKSVGVKRIYTTAEISGKTLPNDGGLKCVLNSAFEMEISKSSTEIMSMESFDSKDQTSLKKYDSKSALSSEVVMEVSNSLTETTSKEILDSDGVPTTHPTEKCQSEPSENPDKEPFEERTDEPFLEPTYPLSSERMDEPNSKPTDVPVSHRVVKSASGSEQMDVPTPEQTDESPIDTLASEPTRNSTVKRADVLVSERTGQFTPELTDVSSRETSVKSTFEKPDVSSRGISNKPTQEVTEEYTEPVCTAASELTNPTIELTDVSVSEPTDLPTIELTDDIVPSQERTDASIPELTDVQLLERTDESTVELMQKSTIEVVDAPISERIDTATVDQTDVPTNEVTDKLIQEFSDDSTPELTESYEYTTEVIPERLLAGVSSSELTEKSTMIERTDEPIVELTQKSTAKITEPTIELTDESTIEHTDVYTQDVTEESTQEVSGASILERTDKHSIELMQKSTLELTQPVIEVADVPPVSERTDRPTITKKTDEPSPELTESDESIQEVMDASPPEIMNEPTIVQTEESSIELMQKSSIELVVPTEEPMVEPPIELTDAQPVSERTDEPTIEQTCVHNHEIPVVPSPELTNEHTIELTDGSSQERTDGHTQQPVDTVASEPTAQKTIEPSDEPSPERTAEPSTEQPDNPIVDDEFEEDLVEMADGYRDQSVSKRDDENPYRNSVIDTEISKCSTQIASLEFVDSEEDSPNSSETELSDGAELDPFASHSMSPTSPETSVSTTQSDEASVPSSADISVPTIADEPVSTTAKMTAPPTTDVSVLSTAEVPISPTADVSVHSTAGVSVGSTTDMSVSSTAEVLLPSTAEMPVSSPTDVSVSVRPKVTEVFNSSTVDVSISSSSDVLVSSTAEISEPASAGMVASPSVSGSVESVPVKSTHPSQPNSRARESISVKSTAGVSLSSTAGLSATSTVDMILSPFVSTSVDSPHLNSTSQSPLNSRIKAPIISPSNHAKPMPQRRSSPAAVDSSDVGGSIPCWMCPLCCKTVERSGIDKHRTACRVPNRLNVCAMVVFNHHIDGGNCLGVGFPGIGLLPTRSTGSLPTGSPGSLSTRSPGSLPTRSPGPLPTRLSGSLSTRSSGLLPTRSPGSQHARLSRMRSKSNVPVGSGPQTERSTDACSMKMSSAHRSQCSNVSSCSGSHATRSRSQGSIPTRSSTPRMSAASTPGSQSKHSRASHSTTSLSSERTSNDKPTSSHSQQADNLTNSNQQTGRHPSECIPPTRIHVSESNLNTSESRRQTRSTSGSNQDSRSSPQTGNKSSSRRNSRSCKRISASVPGCSVCPNCLDAFRYGVFRALMPDHYLVVQTSVMQTLKSVPDLKIISLGTKHIIVFPTAPMARAMATRLGLSAPVNDGSWIHIFLDQASGDVFVNLVPKGSSMRPGIVKPLGLAKYRVREVLKRCIHLLSNRDRLFNIALMEFRVHCQDFGWQLRKERFERNNPIFAEVDFPDILDLTFLPTLVNSFLAKLFAEKSIQSSTIFYVVEVMWFLLYVGWRFVCTQERKLPDNFTVRSFTLYCYHLSKSRVVNYIPAQVQREMANNGVSHGRSSATNHIPSNSNHPFSNPSSDIESSSQSSNSLNSTSNSESNKSNQPRSAEHTSSSPRSSMSRPSQSRLNAPRSNQPRPISFSSKSHRSRSSGPRPGAPTSSEHRSSGTMPSTPKSSQPRPRTSRSSEHRSSVSSSSVQTSSTGRFSVHSSNPDAVSSNASRLRLNHPNTRSPTSASPSCSAVSSSCSPRSGQGAHSSNSINYDKRGSNQSPIMCLSDIRPPQAGLSSLHSSFPGSGPPRASSSSSNDSRHVTEDRIESDISIRNSTGVELRSPSKGSIQSDTISLDYILRATDGKSNSAKLPDSEDMTYSSCTPINSVDCGNSIPNPQVSIPSVLNRQFSNLCVSESVSGICSVSPKSDVEIERRRRYNLRKRIPSQPSNEYNLFPHNISTETNQPSDSTNCLISREITIQVDSDSSSAHVTGLSPQSQTSKGYISGRRRRSSVRSADIELIESLAKEHKPRNTMFTPEQSDFICTLRKNQSSPVNWFLIRDNFNQRFKMNFSKKQLSDHYYSKYHVKKCQLIETLAKERKPRKKIFTREQSDFIFALRKSQSTVDWCLIRDNFNERFKVNFSRNQMSDHYSNNVKKLQNLHSSPPAPTSRSVPPCIWCGMHFTNIRARVTHTVSTHRKCLLLGCRQTFKSVAMFKDHIREHCGMNQRFWDDNT